MSYIKYSDKSKEFYFEDDKNNDRKIIIYKCSEIGFIYSNKTIKTYDGIILAKAGEVIHPMKACRLLKEYWINTADKRKSETENESNKEFQEWIKQPLIAIMAKDFSKTQTLNKADFTRWYRRTLNDYMDKYPELSI